MDLSDRSKFLVEVFEKHKIPKDSRILEIGSGDGRNIVALYHAGYHGAIGIDKEQGSAIETWESHQEFDVIFTMSCLFLIPKENEWVFEKIAKMAGKWLITIEGETTKDNGVIGRDYGEIFTKFGLNQVEHQTEIFNKYGVLRVFKRDE